MQLAGRALPGAAPAARRPAAPGAPLAARRPARCPPPAPLAARPAVASVKGRATAGGRQSTRGGRQTASGGRQTASGKPQTASGRAARQQQPPGGGAPPPPQRRGSRFYFNITGFPFPLGPFFERKTVRREVVKGQVWVFEQTQAFFFDVFTPVRMTVIKLRSGELWVHAPVAPTQECVNLLRELGAPVAHIVLPTFAYEHKVFVGPFSRRFPDAQVWVTPYQWSFPLNLPPQAFGIFPAGELLDGDESVPWAGEIEQKLLLPPPIGVSKAVRFTEVAFFHRASRSLLVTDAVVYVERDPPACIPDAALRSQAQDGWLQRYLAGGRSGAEVAAVARRGRVEDSAEARRTAWARMSLLVLYFNPADLLTPQASFDAVAERLLVGPVVRTLVYDKIPNTVCDWVDAICADWRFERVIPCHFAAPVRAGPAEFREAFRFVYEQAGRAPAAPPAAAAGNPLGGLLGGLFGGGARAPRPRRTGRRAAGGAMSDQEDRMDEGEQQPARGVRSAVVAPGADGKRKGRGFRADEREEEGGNARYEALEGAAGESGPAKSVEGWVLFVTGLHEEAQEEDVAEAFADYGDVKNVYLNLDRQTGYVKGYALIEYGTEKEAREAIKALDGTELLGQAISISWAFVRGGAGPKGARGRR
ncbi:rbm8a [Scenedesmus sp. PABB004]|nr:rbm8a [Scenedesmus sp. PABB004]